jgi:diguanylate cyclase (GGDEF)-like protein
LLGSFLGRLIRHRWAVAWLVAAGIFVATLWWLRHFPVAADPLLYSYVEIVSSLIAFTYAANLLIRFRGTHDLVSLMLAFAFVLTGVIEVATAFAFRELTGADPAAMVAVPLPWMISRTLLAGMLLAALVAERRLPHTHHPGQLIAGAFFAAAMVTYIAAATFINAGADSVVRPDSLLPRPWQLLPATLFLLAALGSWRRSKNAESMCDRAIFFAAVVNAALHIIASQAENLLGAPFATAEALKVASYVIVLGGALLDNAQLFDQVRSLSVSDALTGLANYRRFIATLETEIRRTGRTGRPFSLILLDMDGLKKINDTLGHIVGTRAISRIAEVLRGHCRSMDTAARYGGDEFALILPETGPEAARQVAARITERLAADPEQPPVSASIGLAVYPQDGISVESLLAAADRGLYRMKGTRKGRKRKVPAMAGLE